MKLVKYSLLTYTSSQMNCKLEKFWNMYNPNGLTFNTSMNYKLKKFWNVANLEVIQLDDIWTINLKSFEIYLSPINY